ncbi:MULTISPECIES: DUF362 domain-containing protein [unclassified Haladaptatus]|uniref:DUF362 domain-containing protein n=1 Tax=unclassified Haladaptatus TaxID=2622732 RepID=UPI00209C46F1|nr:MULTISPECIES: DUF362 domain-containing protein [unclassified Haladaptatus]MCO8245377.1 DUF362 domain-containing protein [Haladaptatus sp. AB643]MCO8256814.1 DUF362 domain-containing protein [Haladaptatus sp. AB618]
MEFPDRTDIERLLDPVSLPSFARVRYDPETEAVSDVTATTQDELADLDLSDLDREATVAVGLGSRGIHAIEDVAAATVEFLDGAGFNPVIIPAMGSHGGATAEGQHEVLRALGITEERVGAPVDARMDAEQVGEVTVGGTTTPVYISTAALEADGVLVVNRVKPHTNFTGRIESGLSKMAVVGLGKQRGANAFHSTAIAEGYVTTLESVLDVIRANMSLLGGIALVENFHEETSHIEFIPVDAFEDREPTLLERAHAEMAMLPTDDIDLLVVDEVGKEISGAGMDTNVIGRYRVLNADDPVNPDISLIYVRGLTDRTKGNGNGIGLADVTRTAAVDQLDLRKTYANAMTSGSLEKSKLPVVAPDDELAFRVALSALGGYDPADARIIRIESTQNLTELYVSEAVVDDLPAGTEVVERGAFTFPAGELSFDV